MKPSAVPKGKLVATFALAGCNTPQVAGEASFVDYVQGEDGAPFVVERSDASRWMVVTNSFLESGEIVFQAVEALGQALHEYRFPWDGRTAGKHSVAVSYAEPRGSKDRFRVSTSLPHRVCSLRRVDSTAGEVKPTALPGPAQSDRGWGYTGASFTPGEVVLVDVSGKATRARVMQSRGTDYFVRYEGLADGSGEWISPSRIVGRIK